MGKKSHELKSERSPVERVGGGDKQSTSLPHSTPEGEAVLRVEQFSGPIPHPGVLEGYEQTVPGSAERIIGQFEQEASHRRSVEKAVVQAEVRDKVFYFVSELAGRILAFLAMMTLVAAGVYLALQEGIDKTIVGGLISGSSLLGIVRAFIWGPSVLCDPCAHNESIQFLQ